MRDWGKLFKSCGASGLYTVGGAGGFDKIDQAAAASGLSYVYIDLIKAVDKQAFLQILAGKLRFPEYFGMNWDALKDSLTDMPPGRGWVIALDNIRGFAEADPKGMLTARNIFKYTAGYWSKQAVSFYVLTRL